MASIRLLVLVASVASALAAADLVCESKNSTGAAYDWNDPTAWNCYSQGRVPVIDEYPGKRYPTHQYIVVLGLATNSNVITEHAMNVSSTLGVLGKNYAKWAVAGVADNGSGLIRVTTAANTVATGDKVFCYGFNGTNGAQAYGIWTATAIDTTHFDLQGSTYSGISGVTTGSCEFPAALKRQGANTTTTYGKWKINAGVTATFRGDVVEAWTYNTRIGSGPDWDTSLFMVRCGDATNGGCTWVWDGAGPVAYKLTNDSAAGTDNMGYYIRGTPSQHALFTCLNAGSPCAAATQGSFTYRNYHPIPAFDADYVDFRNLGGTGAFLQIYTDALTVFRLQHFSVVNSGYIQFPAGALMPSSRFTLAYGSMTSSCSASAGCLNNLVGTSAADPLVIGPAVVLKGDGKPLGGSGAVKFDRVYVDAAPGNYTPAGSSMVSSLIAKEWDDQQGTAFGLELLKDSFIWQQHDPVTGNPHTLLVPYHSGGQIRVNTMTIDGNVFQGTQDYNTDGVGQMLDQHAYTSSQYAPSTFIVRNNTMIPNAQYNGDSAARWHSSNSIAFASSSAPASVAVWKFYNNTLFPTTESYATGLDHAGYHVQANTIAEWRCNAVVMSPADSAHQLIGVESISTAVTDNATPSGIHHNAGFGDIRATNDANATNANGTYYYLKLSAPPAGAANGSDQYFPGRVPTIVDYTRRLRTWANQKYGQTFASDIDVLVYLRSDVGGNGPTRLLDIPDLVSWVKAGWTLNEPSLYKACGDGTHIGAAVAAPPAVNPALSSPIVARHSGSRDTPAAPALD